MPQPPTPSPASPDPVVAGRLADTQAAFDSVAADYDGPSGNNSLIQRLRAQTMTAVERWAPAGGRLLDLGCGTGLDAAYLAQRGYTVTATDWSPAMVERTRQRAAAAGLGARLEARQVGLQEIGSLAPALVDAAYSDLGPLNCAPDLAAVAHGLAQVVRPGGYLIASVIGRFCPWELALFAARGNWARARLRFAAGPVPVPLNGHTVWTQYWSPRAFAAGFRRAGFSLRQQRALGLFLPPPYLDAFAARHTALVNFLERLELAAGGWPLLRGWGDHFLVVLQSSPATS
jgi:SAM-dependent methyltransferase